MTESVEIVCRGVIYNARTRRNRGTILYRHGMPCLYGFNVLTTLRLSFLLFRRWKENVVEDQTVARGILVQL